MSASPRSNEAREGRRRRLAERGSDRMALITGQISTLPPPPPPPTPTVPTSRQRLPPRHHRPSLPVELAQELHPDFRTTQSFSISASDEIKHDGSRLSSRLRHQSGFKLPKKMDVDILSQGISSFEDSDIIDAEAKLQVPVDDDDGIKPSSDTLASQSAATTDDDEDKHDASTSSTRLKHQSGFKFSKRSNFQVRSEVKPLTEDSDTNTTNAETKDLVALKPSSAPLRTQNTASDGTKKLLKPIDFNPSSFSSREINSCIIASETLRSFCALVIAVLVVLCYMISEKIAAVRPLNIVLLTDITIVVARVYLEKIRAATEGEEGGGGERVEANHEHGHDWNGVKILERGLVAYQAVRGVFIDCSVYFVVVISCVALMK